VIGAALVLLVAAAIGTYAVIRAGRSPAAVPPPPALSYRTGADSVRVAVIDAAALRDWCAERSLPEPPGITESEPELAEALLAALHRAAAERGADACGEVGMIAEGLDSHASARAYFQLALRANPLDYRWPYYIACVDQITGRMDDAVREFRRSLELEPGYAVTYARLGQIELERGNLALADSLFDAYTGLRKDDWIGLVGSGRIALQRDEPAKALEYLQEAVRRGGDDFQVHRTLGRIHAALGNREEAERHFTRSRELPQGAWFRARDPLDEALHSAGSAVAALETEFERRSASGNWPELTRLAEQILERRSQDVTMMGNLASLYRKQGRYADAHAVLDRGFEVGTDRLRLFLLRSEVALAENDFPRALEAADAALALDPESGRGFGIRGRSLFMLGRLDEAETAMRRSLELQPEDPGNRLVMGELLLRKGDLDAAEAEFRAVLAGGENDHARRRLAEIGQNRIPKADSR